MYTRVARISDSSNKSNSRQVFFSFANFEHHEIAGIKLPYIEFHLEYSL